MQMDHFERRKWVEKTLKLLGVKEEESDYEFWND